MIRTCPNCGKKSLTSVPSGQTRGMILCRSCKMEFPWDVMFPAENPKDQESLGQATLF
jgi:transcription elongation factor Elf1